MHVGFAHAACLSELPMVSYPDKNSYTAQDLVEIIAILRDPDRGCPWDRIQTHRSIRMNFLEEAYEAVDAIDLADPELMCEELGDVLMQVVFHAGIEADAGHFTWLQVCDGVCRKLILRHPNIFGPEAGYEGINDWDLLKNREKGRATLAQDLESVPKALPALMRAAKLQKRAARWPDSEMSSETIAGDAKTVASLAQTLRDAQPGSAQTEQTVGELLFAAAALARCAGVDPEQALQKQNERFAARPPQQP